MTANAAFVIQDGVKVQFISSSTIETKVRYDGNDTHYIDMFVTDGSGGVYGSHKLIVSNSDLTANTATGANDIAKYFNLVEQAVKDYLDGLTGNSGVTFTI